MNNKVSIIIPCYNVEKYVNTCIESAVNQTYQDIEIICVNDGSSDGTLSILNIWAEKDKRVKIIDQINSGVSTARNRAVSSAEGEYIAFVDGDDRIDETAIEKAVDKILKFKCDLVFWSYRKWYGEETVENQVFGETEKLIGGCEYIDFYRQFFGLTGEKTKSPELADSLCTVWGKLYKRELINDVRFKDLKKIGTFEDGLFNIECLIKGKSAYYIPECLYYYRKDNDVSITSKYKQNLFENWQELYNIIENFIDKNNLDNSFGEALSNRVAMSIIGLGLNEVLNPLGAKQQIKNLKKIIKSEGYHTACSNLTLMYFPLHWKIFFALAKREYVIGLFLLLRIINFLRGKIL